MAALKLSMIVMFTCVISIANSQSCDIFFDDFSDPSSWTQVGINVEVQNSRAEFNNAAGGVQRRVYKSIGSSLNSGDVWSVEVDFHMTSAPTGSTGHNPLAITETDREPFNDCPDVPCTGYPPGTQDCIAITFATSLPTTSDRSFRITAREGNGSLEFRSPLIPATATNTTYYLTLERISSTETVLGIFADQARTIHISGSPVNLTIPSTITGLTTAQINVNARSNPNRQLNGWVDNICISSQTTLPVQLLDFKGAPDPSGVRLSWRTSDEINNSGFEIQRAIDKRNWEIIAFQPASTTNNLINEYSYVDIQPFNGINYYRLRQLDLNGSYDFSPIIAIVKDDGHKAIRLYPNPTSSTVRIVGMQSGTIEIVNSMGRLMETRKFSAGSTIDISHIPNGIYFLVAKSKYDRTIARIVKN